MYNRRDPRTGEVMKEFQDGLRGLINQATNQPHATETGKNILSLSQMWKQKLYG